MGSKVRQIDEYVCAEMIKSDIELNYDKFYKDDLIRLLEACRKEYKKQKEVIDKINKFCKEDKNFEILDLYSQDKVDEIQAQLLDILKEVSE